MALHQIQLDGDAARQIVRQVYPAATSAYTGAVSAQVYDPVTDVVLGSAQAEEFAVEHAWVTAAQVLHKTELRYAQKGKP